MDPGTNQMKNSLKSLGFKHQLRISNGQALTWTDYRKESSSIYCVYFQIYYEDFSKKSKKENYYVFTFRIQSVLFPDINYTVEKRYSEFVTLASKLKNGLTVTPPALPQRTYLINSEDNMTRRARGLSEWSSIVANEKFYHCLELFSFFNLPRDKVNAYLSYNPLKKLHEKFLFEFRIEKSVDMTNEDLDNTFKLYFIQIKIKDKELLDLVSAYHVKRRYKEFNHLNKILKKKFKRYKKKLPDFPKKFNFEKQGGRKMKLEKYLNEIVDYPDIWECVYVRKFLQVNPLRFNEFSVKHH